MRLLALKPVASRLKKLILVSFFKLEARGL